MTFIRPDGLSTLLFALICLAILLVFARSVYIVEKKYIVVSLLVYAWLALFSNAVRVGLISPAFPQNIMMAFISSVLVGLMIGFSPVGRKIGKHFSIKSLILFQAFRLPLELVLHRWVQEGSIPNTMTWTGMNFDIVTGILAITAYFFVDQHRWLAWLFNLVGIILLFRVARVAVMSAPLPFAWKVTPPLQVLFHMPYALILPICVGGALAGHVILTRALINRK